MLLLLWANFYFAVSESFERNAKFRANFTCCVCVMIILIVGVCFLIEIIWGSIGKGVESFNFWVALTFAIFEVAVVIGYFYFGVLLMMMLGSEYRELFNRKLKEVKTVSFIVIVCALILLVKAVLTMVGTAENEEFFSQSHFHHFDWDIALIYLLILEIIPAVLMLFLLSVIRKWKFEDIVDPGRNSMLLFESHPMESSGFVE
eukprot:TRINITY_DN5670_c0_g1_i2.p1 TRINITY_DN5670_c0_g1~~TRINITY_DN5670_c0_g1_i2.p1  ORF type:complete len:203 (-),score=48.32 TRINITY_DN5670_c0_g1_i2:5-613(-)